MTHARHIRCRSPILPVRPHLLPRTSVQRGRSRRAALFALERTAHQSACGVGACSAALSSQGSQTLSKHALANREMRLASACCRAPSSAIATAWRTRGAEAGDFFRQLDADPTQRPFAGRSRSVFRLFCERCLHDLCPLLRRTACYPKLLELFRVSGAPAGDDVNSIGSGTETVTNADGNTKRYAQQEQEVHGGYRLLPPWATGRTMPSPKRSTACSRPRYSRTRAGEAARRTSNTRRSPAYSGKRPNACTARSATTHTQQQKGTSNAERAA